MSDSCKKNCLKSLVSEKQGLMLGGGICAATAACLFALAVASSMPEKMPAAVPADAVQPAAIQKMDSAAAPVEAPAETAKAEADAKPAAAQAPEAQKAEPAPAPAEAPAEPAKAEADAKPAAAQAPEAQKAEPAAAPAPQAKAAEGSDDDFFAIFRSFFSEAEPKAPAASAASVQAPPVDFAAAIDDTPAGKDAFPDPLPVQDRKIKPYVEDKHNPYKVRVLRETSTEVVFKR